MKKICIIFLLFLSACSFIKPVLKPTHKKAVGTIELESKIPIYISEVLANDTIEQGGIIKYGIEYVSMVIKTEPNASVIIKKAIVLELQNAGFKVEEIGSKKGITLCVNLYKYFVEPKLSLFYARIYSSVIADITVFFPNGRTFRRLFGGKGRIYTPIWSSYMPVWGEIIYANALELATEDMVKKMILALCQLVEKELKVKYRKKKRSNL